VENRAIGTPRSNYPICLRWSPMPDSVHVREVPYLEFPRLRSQRCWISRVLSLSKTNLLRTCILDRINELTSMYEKRVTIFRFFERVDRFVSSVDNFVDRSSHEIKIYLRRLDLSLRYFTRMSFNIERKFPQVSLLVN